MPTNDRRDGRQQGQGWLLEQEMAHALLQEGYDCQTRVRIWKREVDIVARRSWPSWPHREDGRIAPKRVVVSCVDWFSKQITPARLWRLVVMAYTLRAEPVLARNHRARLTETAQAIAEQWRVRVVTFREIRSGRPLPEPEKPDNAWNSNPAWPTPMTYDVDPDVQWGPDYYYDIDTPRLRQDSLDRIYREADR